MIPFEKFLFLFNGFPRVCLIGNVDASYRFFSLSRQRGMKISLSTNERIEFRVTRRNDDSGWEEGEKKRKGNNHGILYNVFRREGNERKMANPTVRENLKFYQMGSIREPVPPRFISNDGKIYSNVVPIINIFFRP